MDAGATRRISRSVILLLPLALAAFLAFGTTDASSAGSAVRRAPSGVARPTSPPRQAFLATSLSDIHRAFGSSSSEREVRLFPAILRGPASAAPEAGQRRQALRDVVCRCRFAGRGSSTRAPPAAVSTVS